MCFFLCTLGTQLAPPQTPQQIVSQAEMNLTGKWVQVQEGL